MLTVHFGVHKTGSSSIQETLFANADALGAVTYIHPGVPNSSQFVSQAFLQGDKLVNAVQPDHREPGRLAGMQTRARARFAQLLQAHPPDAQLLLSAEAITQFNEAECRDFIEAVREHHGTSRFRCYVRDPVSYWRAAFQETLKVRFRPFGTDSAQDAAQQFTCHHNMIVERLDALVGAENVTVSAFDRDRFPQGDVVRHFLQELGIDTGSITIHHVNEGLPRLAVKALYCYRRYMQPDDHRLGHPASREAFIRNLAQLGGPPLQLHPDVADQITRVNSSFLSWCERRVDGQLESARSCETEGIRSVEDLTHFTDEECARLVDHIRRNDLAELPRTVTPEWVAAHVHGLRLRCMERARGEAQRGRLVNERDRLARRITELEHALERRREQFAAERKQRAAAHAQRIRTLRGQIAQLRDSQTRMQDVIAQRSATYEKAIADWRASTDALRERHQRAQKAFAERSEKEGAARADLRTRLHETEAERARLTAELTRLRKENRQALAEMEARQKIVENDLNEAIRQLEALLASRSWRLTAPLRASVRLARAIGDRLPFRRGS